MKTTALPRVILLLQADVEQQPQLRLGEEARKIRDAIEGSKHRSRFRLETRIAVRRRDILNAVLDLQPAMVHFCGHASPSGLIIEGESGTAEAASARAVADFFQIFRDRIRCVVLNACSTALQAEMISEHIDFVIGTQSPLEDQLALTYAEAFYQALGSGSGLRAAHRIACNALLWATPDDQNSPYRLWAREDAIEDFSTEPCLADIYEQDAGNLLLALRDLEIEDIYLLGSLVGIRRAELGSGNILALAVNIKERAVIEGKLPLLVQMLCQQYPQVAGRRRLRPG